MESAMNESEVLVTCPYNRSHSIIKSRMQFHLTRCKLQSGCADMVTCPYNSTHVFSSSKIEEHLDSCPNRYVLDSFVYNVGDVERPGIVPVNNNAVFPKSEENWDENPTNKSVLDVIRKNIKEKPVFQNIFGAPRAERRAHRAQERLRYQRILASSKTKEKNKVMASTVDEASNSPSTVTTEDEIDNNMDVFACNSVETSYTDNNNKYRNNIHKENKSVSTNTMDDDTLVNYLPEIKQLDKRPWHWPIEQKEIELQEMQKQTRTEANDKYYTKQSTSTEINKIKWSFKDNSKSKFSGLKTTWTLPNELGNKKNTDSFDSGTDLQTNGMPPFSTERAMNGSEVLVTCPYNRSHSIIKSRMQFHLSRCKLQSGCEDMTTCPYNSTHVFSKAKIEEHLDSCPNRYVLDSFVYSFGAVERAGFVPVNNNVELPQSEENWDENPTNKSVLDVIRKNIKEKAVFQNIFGAPRAERRAHRAQERLRYQRIVASSKAKEKNKVKASTVDQTSNIPSPVTSEDEIGNHNLDVFACNSVETSYVSNNKNENSICRENKCVNTIVTENAIFDNHYNRNKAHGKKTLESVHRTKGI